MPRSTNPAGTAPRSLAEFRRHPIVDDVSDERGGDNGIWIYLKSGWSHEGETHSLHEDTVAELRAAWGMIEPCRCRDCQPPTKKGGA